MTYSATYRMANIYTGLRMYCIVITFIALIRIFDISLNIHVSIIAYFTNKSAQMVETSQHLAFLRSGISDGDIIKSLQLKLIKYSNRDELGVVCYCIIRQGVKDICQIGFSSSYNLLEWITNPEKSIISCLGFESAKLTESELKYMTYRLRNKVLIRLFWGSIDKFVAIRRFYTRQATIECCAVHIGNTKKHYFMCTYNSEFI